VLLLDSAHLQEEDARRANRYGFSRHAKALPLYTRADASGHCPSWCRWRPARCPVGRHVALSPVGHLLGACAVHAGARPRIPVFSGDLGRSGDLLMPPPQPLTAADVLLVESTYGNRATPPRTTAAAPGEIVRDTVQRGGSVLLPSFAVGRAQALLLCCSA
jgi:metallo-beta-lactamase family protein